jgi:hypothetical protein
MLLHITTTKIHHAAKCHVNKVAAQIPTGALLVGAAAGAATGAAVSNGKRGSHGHIGATGPSGATGAISAVGATGPTGPAGAFPVDTGETLTFDSGLTVSAGAAGSTAIGFVSLPDGTVLETAAVTPLVIGLNTIPTIVVTDPEFGTYTVGVQVTSGVVAVNGTLTDTVTSSRDGVTTIAQAIPAVGIISAQTQTSADFTYGTTVP